MPYDPGYLETRDPRVWERLLRAQDLKGDIPQLLAALLSPVALLEDYSQPEYAWLRRTRRLTAASSIGAVAAQYPVVQLTNASSNRIIRVRQLSILNMNAGGAITVGVGIVKTAVAVFGSLTFPMCDDRQPPTTAPGAGNMGATNLAAPMTEMLDMFRLRMPADTMVVLDVPWVLAGLNNGYLTIHGQNQNTALGASVVYDERDQLSSET